MSAFNAEQYYFIDNKGAGHCMYYAYAISLMHHLKSIKDEVKRAHDAHYVFDKLQLSAAENDLCMTLVNQQTPYTLTQLTDIQDTLGPKLRQCAVARRFEPFKLALTQYHALEADVPDEFRAQALNELLMTSTYTAIAYPIRNALYQAALLTHEHTQTVSSAYILNEFKPSSLQVDLFQSDIFLMEGLTDRLNAFVRERFSTEESHRQLLAYTCKTDLDHLVASLVTEFYLRNEARELNSYKVALERARKWGSDEELHALNAYLSGDRLILTDEGRYDEHQDVHLAVCMLSVQKTYIENGSNLFLYNIGNAHWISAIPKALVDVEASLCRSLPMPKAQSFFRSMRHADLKPLKETDLKSLVEINGITQKETETLYRLVFSGAINRRMFRSFCLAWITLKQQANEIMIDCNEHETLQLQNYLNSVLERFTAFTLSCAGSPHLSLQEKRERLDQYLRVSEIELNMIVESSYSLAIARLFYRFMNFIMDLLSLAPYEPKLAKLDELDTRTKHFYPTDVCANQGLIGYEAYPMTTFV